MSQEKIPCGGFFINSDQFEFTKDQWGRPILNMIGGGGGTDIAVRIHNADPKAHENIQLDCGEIK